MVSNRVASLFGLGVVRPELGENLRMNTGDLYVVVEMGVVVLVSVMSVSTFSCSFLPSGLKPHVNIPLDNSDSTRYLSIILSVLSGGFDLGTIFPESDLGLSSCLTALEGRNLAPDTLLLVCTDATTTQLSVGCVCSGCTFAGTGVAICSRMGGAKEGTANIVPFMTLFVVTTETPNGLESRVVTMETPSNLESSLLTVKESGALEFNVVTVEMSSGF